MSALISFIKKHTLKHFNELFKVYWEEAKNITEVDLEYAYVAIEEAYADIQGVSIFWTFILNHILDDIIPGNDYSEEGMQKDNDFADALYEDIGYSKLDTLLCEIVLEINDDYDKIMEHHKQFE